MKKITFLIILLLTFAFGGVQANEYEKTETRTSLITVKSKIKVLYKTVRPAIKDHQTIALTDTMELFTGGNKSLYQAWNKDLKDSLLDATRDKVSSGQHRVTVVYSEFQFKKITKSDNYTNWNENWETENLYKDYHKNKFFYVDYLKRQWMMSEREIPAPKWNIETETSTVLGYLCHKATTSFMGRDYEAWFTEDIPLQDGPWLFSGLPGLIMKVQDNGSKLSFEAVGIEKLKTPVIKNISEKNTVKEVSYKDYYGYKLVKYDDVKYYYVGSDGIIYFCYIDNPVKLIPIELDKK